MTTTTTTERADLIEDIKARNAYHLSGDADCSSPDSHTSPGALMLLSVRDSVIEAIEYAPAILDDDEWHDMTHDIADQAPDVYAHTKWAEFVDLAAYNEDPSDLGAESDDMDKAASVCLYIIAERLAGALFSELAEADNEPENDDDDA